MATTYDPALGQPPVADQRVGNPIMGRGFQGGEVAWLKQVLHWWGIGAGTGDVFDTDAEAAVRQFQAKYGYEQTGVMDDSTWALMDALAHGRPAPNAVGQQDMGPIPGDPYNGGPERGTGSFTSPAAPLSSAQRDGLARLQALLRGWGLEGMTQWLTDKLILGASDDEIEIELYDQPQFKARFPVIDQRTRDKLTPVSPAAIMEYEKRTREMFRAAGLTNPKLNEFGYIQSLMGRDVSLAELNDRIQDGLLKVTMAPPEVRVAFGTYFGTNSDAALAELFLNPDTAEPELEKMAMTAYAGGVGSRFGVQLAMGIARQIADTGASDAAVWSGFQKIDEISALFNETIGEQTDLSKGVEGVAAVFGTQPGAIETLETRRMGRKGVFSGGGQAAANESGILGLGVADS